jgi:phenylacetic acid degradation protein
MPIYAIEDYIPVVDPTAFVHPTATLIGDAVVGPHCYVGPGASMRGDFGRVTLSKGANLQDLCVMHAFPGNESIVEEDGHVGHSAVLHGCRIGRNALVGMSAVIMDGAVIGEESFVAAMSFVKAGFVVPPRTLAAGIPAKIVRELTQQEVDWKAGGTRGYQELAQRSLATLRECKPLPSLDPNRKPRPATNAVPLDQLKKLRT